MWLFTSLLYGNNLKEHGESINILWRSRAFVGTEKKDNKVFFVKAGNENTERFDFKKC